MKNIPAVGTRVVVKNKPIGQKNGVNFTVGMSCLAGKEFYVVNVGNSSRYGDWCSLSETKGGTSISYFWYPWMLKKSNQEKIDEALDAFANFMLDSDGSMNSVEYLEMYRESHKKVKKNEKDQG